jgi:hypothetical protein
MNSTRHINQYNVTTYTLCGSHNRDFLVVQYKLLFKMPFAERKACTWFNPYPPILYSCSPIKRSVCTVSILEKLSILRHREQRRYSICQLRGPIQKLWITLRDPPVLRLVRPARCSQMAPRLPPLP